MKDVRFARPVAVKGLFAHALLLSSALLLSCAVPSLADQWGPATRQHWSQNRLYVLRVSDTGTGLTLFRQEGKTRKKVWARAFDRAMWPPYLAYVADDGQHVVLQDCHGELGHGKILSFLGPDGSVLRSYEIDDLLTDDQITWTKHSISSIWWSEPGWFSFVNDGKHFALLTYHGVMACFAVETGERVVPDAGLAAVMRRQAEAYVMALLKSRKETDREAGAILSGTLGMMDTVPVLKELLKDRAVTRGVISDNRPRADVYGVQIAAAGALVSLVKADAIPLILAELGKSNPYVRGELIDKIANLGGDYSEVPAKPWPDDLRRMWLQLMSSELSDVRQRATQEFLYREDPQYVYDHPELLRSTDDGTRSAALSCLVERGDQRAIPMLRGALNDANWRARWHAVRGLIRCKPDDLTQLLHEALKDSDRGVRLEAITVLIRQNDPAAIQCLVGRIASLEKHSHDREGWGSEDFEAKDLCRLVAELKLHDVREALERASSNACPDVRWPACGALAGLGDPTATEQLRTFALSGERGRYSAFEFLALALGRDALPILETGLKDKRHWIRSAARRAIKELEAGEKTPKQAGPAERP